MYQLLIGGAAGDGIETMAGILEEIIVQKGFYLFSMRDFMSRVRGGHNFNRIRFSSKPVYTHCNELNGIIAMNKDSANLHKKELSPGGFILADAETGLKGESLVLLPLVEMAKQAGNPKTLATVCLGAALKLFGLGIQGAARELKKNLPEPLWEVNLKALKLGYNAAPEWFKAAPAKNRAPVTHVTGAEAMAIGALAGGMRFYSGYPMSPSTSLLSFFTKQSEFFGLAVEQAEDEIAAANMAIGAAFAGARAMTATSGGGFSLMVEALGLAAMAEVPLVIANIMRPGPSTGQPTRTEQGDLLFMCYASHGEFPRMVIAVRSHEDAIYQTARAFRLAWQYQIPVLLLSDQYLADSSAVIPAPDVDRACESAEIPEEFIAALQDISEYKRYRIVKNGVSPMLHPGQTPAVVKANSEEHDEEGLISELANMRVAQVDKRGAKEKLLLKELNEPYYSGSKEPKVLLIGFGSTLCALQEAVATLRKEHNMAAGALCFGDIYPLPQKMLKKYAAKAKHIINVEQNSTGQLATLLRSEAMVDCTASILKYDGRQISQNEIIGRVLKICRKEGK